MVLFDGAFGLLVLALWLFCLFDVISAEESLCRNLAKGWWVVIVLLFPLVGSLAWLVGGRPKAGASSSLPYRGSQYPEYERPGRFAATAAEDDAEFLQCCRERAEEQRRRYREQQGGRDPRRLRRATGFYPPDLEAQGLTAAPSDLVATPPTPASWSR